MNPSEMKKVMVIGAGTMGHSIAQVYAQAGFEVDLVDIDQKKLEHAIKLIKSNLEVLAEFNRIQKNNISKIIDLIHPTTDLEIPAQRADLVVEAVSEVPELKEKIFKQLSDYCNENIIFASNTSSLDIFKIAKDIKNPSRLITHHYYAPPHIIPLVEIAPGKKTSKEVVEFSVKLMKKLGKNPIVMKKFAPSYIVNKIQNAISGVMYELLIRDLATVEQIDTAIKTSLGIRLPIVGIVQSQDFTGLDLVYDIQKSMGITVPPIKERAERGYLGVKSGKGFYDYQERNEEEILQKRDRLYLKMLEHLERIEAFKPI
jgi:3-hydroxybutyryl-CoA dehydrogenase